jgi:hypothetical protein
MSTVPDPMSIHWPEMIDNQEKNTAFLKPLVTSPKIEVGEFTYYNDADEACWTDSNHSAAGWPAVGASVSRFSQSQ